jgi:DNA-binding GntR family transcriptional regulator
VKTRRDSNVLLGDVAYEAVREAIATNRIKPGERISEYKIADWLKISRTPAREGLRRLESEGLLTSHPRRGLVVAGLDEDAIHELYGAREVLEGTVAGMAARFATDAEISALQHALEVESQIADLPDKMFEHNRDFHQLIYRAARNRYLLKFLLTISDTLSTYRSVTTMVSAPRREEVLREHRELVDAIARHDEQAAREAAARHIQGALRARIAVQRRNAAAQAPGTPATAQA